MRLLARTVRCLQGGGGPAARARGATRLSRDLRSAAGGSPGRAARTLETPGKRTPAASRACCRRSGRSGAARARRPSRSSTAAGRRASLGPKPRRLQGATSRRKMMSHLAGAEQRGEAAARPGGLRPAPRPACAPGRPRRRRDDDVRRAMGGFRASGFRASFSAPNDGTTRRPKEAAHAPPQKNRTDAAQGRGCSWSRSSQSLSSRLSQSRPEARAAKTSPVRRNNKITRTQSSSSGSQPITPIDRRSGSRIMRLKA